MRKSQYTKGQVRKDRFMPGNWRKARLVERESHKRPTQNPYDLSEATHNYAGKQIKEY